MGSLKYKFPLIRTIVFILLVAFDSLSTHYLIEEGYVEEINPLMNWLIGVGWIWFFTFKFFFITLLILLLIVAHERKIKVSKNINICLIGYSAIYIGGIIISNLYYL